MRSSFSHLSHISKSFAITLALVGLAYFSAAKLGLMVPYKESVVTLMWLPTGIAVGAIMRWGKMTLPVIYLTAAAVEFSAGLPLLTSLSIALTNTLAPFVTAHLLKKFNFNYRLIRQRDIVLMIVLALFGMLISSTFGILSLYSSGLITQQNITNAWFIWWVGDSIGVLLALPLMLNIGR